MDIILFISLSVCIIPRLQEPQNQTDFDLKIISESRDFGLEHFSKFSNLIAIRDVACENRVIISKR